MCVHARMCVGIVLGTCVHANDASDIQRYSHHRPAAHLAFSSLSRLITSIGLAPLPHFAFSDALSLQEHMNNLNDHDPAAIASLGHFVEFAKLHAFDAAPLIAMVLELRVPKTRASASLRTATE